MKRCLYCYKELADDERDFHKSCSKKIFGTPQVPLLPYTRANIAELAREVIRSQTTLTGVQAKLSLDIAKEGKGTPERFTIVGLWGRYILKPQTEHYPHLPELEDLTMHMAEAVKMQVVPHSLVRFADGELCYITRRIDRGPHGEKYLRTTDRTQIQRFLRADCQNNSALFFRPETGCRQFLGASVVLLAHGQCRHAPQKFFAV